MVAEKISIDNAKKEKLFYFVANVVIHRDDGRCLILKRGLSEKVHPGKYAVPGGKLEWVNLDLKKPTRINGDVLDYENAIEELLSREVMEEAGIKIKKDLAYINSVAFVRPDGIPVVLVKLAARYDSGDVKLEEGSFTDYAWVNEREVRNFDCIKGIDNEISAAIRLFSR
ncbi:MAG: NUDIX domain-containing protein [Candidatus Micrarchaeaceae archaeon]